MLMTNSAPHGLITWEGAPDTDEFPLVMTIDDDDVEFNGVWPGWPAAIALLMFTERHDHPSVPWLTQVLSEMQVDESADSANAFLTALDDGRGDMDAMTDVFVPGCELSSCDIFDGLREAAARILREKGARRIGPYYLTASMFS